MTRASFSCLLVVAAVAVTAPAPARALGLPPTFPRTIAILHDTPLVHPTAFEVSTRVIGTKVRVRVRAELYGIGTASKVVMSVGPCTGGTVTSPLCRPTASARVLAPVGGTHWVRAFLVDRPSARRDALRVTLTPAGEPVPYRPERVGGGGGMGEILLNAGAWRFMQGTNWGIRTSAPAGTTMGQVKFNSRTYQWAGLAKSETRVATKIGYTGRTPRWDFANTMRADAPFTFRRTPTSPVQERRSTPRSFTFSAGITGGASLFTARVPLPRWNPAG